MNADDEIASEQIKKTILASCRPAYLTTDRKDIRVRCPYCGDSHTHADSAHFYIHVEPPFMYHCVRCGAHGMLNPNVLKDLKIYNNDASLAVMESAKRARASDDFRFHHYKKTLDLTPSDMSAASRSLSYINGRIGTDLSADDAIRYYSVVLDPIGFFNKNGIKAPNQFNFAESVGFASSDRSHIIFRDMSGTQEKRYNNLRLAGEDEDASKIYSVSSDADYPLTTSLSTTLVVAEGIFDIIGICENLYRRHDPDPSAYRFMDGFVFLACCGKGYPTTITSCFRKLGSVGMPIRIYSDDDVDPDFYRDMLSEEPTLGYSDIELHYNGFPGEKDFGVPSAKISEKQSIILN